MSRGEVGALALALPASVCIVLWDRLDVYKVGGRVFASCGEADGLSFKARTSSTRCWWAMVRAALRRASRVADG